jgi:hypothetical protein
MDFLTDRRNPLTVTDCRISPSHIRRNTIILSEIERNNEIPEGEPLRRRLNSRYTFDNSNVPLGGPAKRAQRCFVGFAIMGSNCGLHAGKLDEHSALGLSGLEGLRRFASAQEAAAPSLNRGSSEFGVLRQRRRIRN